MAKLNDKETYCQICKYYKDHRCKLWEVRVPEPGNSHCESYSTKEARQ